LLFDSFLHIVGYTMGRINRKLNAKLGKEKKLKLSSPVTASALAAAVSGGKTSAGAKKAIGVSSPSSSSLLTGLMDESVAVVKKPTKKSPALKTSGTDDSTTKTSNSKVGDSEKKYKYPALPSRIGKKEKMAARAKRLRLRLTQQAAADREAKAKVKREKTVIVKDVKPLLDNLLEIEETIVKDNLHGVKKDKKKKLSKSTLKEKKRQEQFLKDLEFLQKANSDPAYVKNPLKTLTTHIQNTHAV